MTDCIVFITTFLLHLGLFLHIITSFWQNMWIWSVTFCLALYNWNVYFYKICKYSLYINVQNNVKHVNVIYLRELYWGPKHKIQISGINKLGHLKQEDMQKIVMQNIQKWFENYIVFYSLPYLSEKLCNVFFNFWSVFTIWIIILEKTERANDLKFRAQDLSLDLHATEH
jgi:hypothetical protein